MLRFDSDAPISKPAPSTAIRSQTYNRTVKQILLLALLGCTLSSAADWQIVWRDEFDGKAGSLPDSTKWTYDLGSGGWGNKELETYTNSPDNVHLDGNGHLVIRVIKTQSGYTSARLKTQGKFATAYGKVEARMKIPFGQGIWPAFWMLGEDISKAGWPACGEIDVMENIGKEPNIVHGTVHGPGYSGGNGIGKSITLKNRVADDFHIFTVVWEPESIEFFVDGVSYHKVTPASLPANTQWVFNKPFFLLLNLAVGGSWPGNPDDTTQFPQDLIVDWVRVSKKTDQAAIHSGAVVNAASFDTNLAPGALATLFGVNLGEGTKVTVNGVPAPLTFVNDTQANFQIPWSTPLNIPVEVHVARNNIDSNSEMITLNATAPSIFAVTCSDTANCTLWGNGFGQTMPPQQDGVPANASPLPYAASTCRLTIAGADTLVTYCGAAPGLLIDQLNFVAPSLTGPVAARLTVGEQSVDFLLAAQT